MKIGFACGVFDMFHAGHVLMLKECKENCDTLVVALNSCKNIDTTINPDKQPPLYSLAERKLILEACRYVDKVLEYDSEEELLEIMRTGQFSVRFLGEDYKGKPITGESLIPQIHWIDRGHGLSTSGYKKRMKL